MKRKFTLIILLHLSILSAGLTAYAQSPGFVQQDIIKVPGMSTDAQINALPVGQRQTSRVFYDGLGRPVQTIAVQASPLKNDLIQAAVYDNLGRQTTAYLPYAGKSTDSMGGYRPNALSTDQPAFYNQTTQYLVAKDASPFTQQVFESSPLQRVQSAGTVGAGFQPVSGQHYKTISYRPNNAASDGNILVWNPDGTYTAGTYYHDNMLGVSDGKDEDNVETLSFSDLAGHVILKRQILASGNLDTYYIYNNAGMIAFVVPPKALALMVAGSNYSLTQTGVNKLIFKFVYDAMGRLVEKTVPAKGVMYIVYDPLNRPVLSQDSNMRVNNTWAYVKYDAQGRPFSTGTYTDATHTTRSSMQTYVSGLNYSVWYESRTNSGAYNYYTNNVFPTTGCTPLTYAYFDDYDVTNSGTDQFSYTAQGLANEEMPTMAKVKGMPTAITQTTVGVEVTSGEWFTKVTFYDKRGNPIQVKSNNHVYYQGIFNLTDTKTSVPDFMGVPQITKVSKQSGASTTTTVQTNLTYDHVNRVTAVDQYYNGSTRVNHIAGYSYNELGQLIKKNLQPVSTAGANITLDGTNSVASGTTTTMVASNSITFSPGFTIPSGATYNAYISTGALQVVDYRYNIRGQLLSINNSKLASDTGKTNNDINDIFGMVMLYDKTDGQLSTTPSYSGRLTGVKWMSSNGAGGTSYERAYSYYYDQLGRDTAAVYAERAAGSTGAFTVTHGWDEDRITYDQGGNIQTLYRNAAAQGTGGHAAIDNLAYTYSSTSPNQLASVADASGSSQGFIGGSGTYSYDGNGNLTNEPYKGISTIGYDVLNKTEKITFTVSANRYIDYTYDASGNLIRKRQYDNVNGAAALQHTTDYIDGFVYLDGTLQYFGMPEGRIVNNGGSLVAAYTITDQQGNARVEFDNTGSGETLHLRQENSYYAFGMIMPGSVVATPTNDNKKLYNGGSEWQNDFGNLPDYYQTFFRNYDAALGRWIGVDPVAESAHSMTSYQYAGNNPIMFNDPLGDLLKTPPAESGPTQPVIHLHNGVYDQLMGDLGEFEDEGGGGMYTSDPGGAWYAGIMGGQEVYYSGYKNSDGTTAELSRGSLADGAALINSAVVAQGGTAPISENTFSVYVSDGGNILMQTAYQSDNSGTTYYRSSQSVEEGQFVTTAAGAVGNTILPGANSIIDNIIGGTVTTKTGDELKIPTAIGTFNLAGYSSVSKSGGEHLINLNFTKFKTREGVETTGDSNINLGVYKLKFTSDIGVETEFGTESWNLNVGLSWEKGISLGGAVNGHGFDASYRPNIGGLALIGTALAAPEALPEVWRLITH